ncbi:MAG: DUF3052 family protein [Myxococcales bacterium]|nr:DUF3052 family protein [Myxococcales bacterium]
MGLEAECTVRVGRRASSGKALLEAETLLFRGDFRLDIPFERMREVAVEGDALVVRADDEARFELGARVAERWLRLIKHPKGLFEKLELDATSRVAVVDVADPSFVAALRERVGGMTEGRVSPGAPVIFFGAETPDALRKVRVLRGRMNDGGVLWIVRPKGPRGVPEAAVLEAARDAGLVDVKVVAFSKTHTAHKCVVPLELRGQARRRPPVVTIPPAPPVLARGGEHEGDALQGEEGAEAAAARRGPDLRSTIKPRRRA